MAFAFALSREEKKSSAIRRLRIKSEKDGVVRAREKSNRALCKDRDTEPLETRKNRREHDEDQREAKTKRGRTIAMEMKNIDAEVHVKRK